jgi:xanthine/CO dehydrogenase XdhC/CoxF family maturation factor
MARGWGSSGNRRGAACLGQGRGGVHGWLSRGCFPAKACRPRRAFGGASRFRERLGGTSRGPDMRSGDAPRTGEGQGT